MSNSRYRFENEDPTVVPRPWWDLFKWLISRQRVEESPPHTTFETLDYPKFSPPQGDIRVFYIGHATTLIEMDGVRILTDPIFREKCTPLSFVGKPRLQPPGLALDDLPPVDVILISHSHYDHLDFEAVKHFGNSPLYIIPEGLKHWFEKSGITNILELGWWSQEKLESGLSVTAVPCQHWSRRTPFDTNQSHWNGYVLRMGHLKVLFIGDSGYCIGFARLGEKLGPFHLAIIPIGAYEPQWFMQPYHMNPEEAVQTYLDCHAVAMLPTHYGVFRLTDEPVDEPVSRLLDEWERRDLDHRRLWLLRPGEFRCIEDVIYIPTIQHDPAPEAALREVEEETSGEIFSEWSVGICPHLSQMVDLEAVGVLKIVATGREAGRLSLRYLTCSSKGDIPQCDSKFCPLRDPAFLSAHGLHGITDEDNRIHVFSEFNNPPSRRYWSEELLITRKLEADAPEQ